MGFPCGSAGKESACNVGDLGLIPGLGRSPGEGKGYPLQYLDPENSMDYSPWGHKESDTTERLSFSLATILPSSAIDPSCRLLGYLCCSAMYAIYYFLLILG